MQCILQLQSNLQFYLSSHTRLHSWKNTLGGAKYYPLPLGRAEPNPQTLSIASVWADQPGSTAPVWLRPRAREKEFESSLTAGDLLNLTILTSLSSLLFYIPTQEVSRITRVETETLPPPCPRLISGWSRVRRSPRRIFLDDILMSHEKPLGAHGDPHAAPGRFLPRPERGRD